MTLGPDRGSVVRVDATGLARGSEAGAVHSILAVVVQADRFRYGRTVLVVPFTSNLAHAQDPRGVRLVATRGSGLKQESVAMCWQLMAVDRDRLVGSPVGRIAPAGMDLIAKAIAILIDYQPGFSAEGP